MITKFGKRFIASYLAGMVSFPKQDIAIGVSDGTDYAASDSNTRLGFEFYRLPASFGSIDIQTDGGGNSTYSVIYKATLPQDIAGIVKEIALYPGSRTSINNFDSKFISDFENNLSWTDLSGQNPALVAYSEEDPIYPVPRIGSSLIMIETPQGSSEEYSATISPFDISGYSANDSLSLVYEKDDTNLSSIKVKLYSSDTAYHMATFTASGAAGQKIANINLSALTTHNGPTSTITKVAIEVTAGSGGDSVVYLDGLRINDEDTFDPTFGMIARDVLVTPLEKKAGKPVDIEYKIGLTF
jgi:hypothetical protein